MARFRRNLLSAGRNMRSFHIALLILAGCLLALLNTIPLAWVKAFVEAPQIEQSTWSGTVKEGYVSNIEGLPTVKLTGGVLGLLTGNAKVESQNPSSPLTAKIGLGGVSDIRASLPNSMILPISGGTSQITLTELPADLSCTDQTGQFSTDALRYLYRAQGWQGPDLAGPISCEDGKWRAELTGQDQRITIRAVTLTTPYDKVETEVVIQTQDGELAQLLPVLGFEQAGGEFRRREIVPWSRL